MKDIPILVNFNRHNDSAYDARGISAGWIANLNFLHEQLFSNLRRNLNVVRRRSCNRRRLRLRKQARRKNR